MVLIETNHFKLCIKKNNNQKIKKRKLCMKQWIFVHQIWLNQKKSKNIANYHYVLAIPLFSIVVSFITNSSWQVVTDLKIDPRLASLFYPSIVAYLWFVVKLMWKCCGLSIFFFFIWSIRNWDLNNCENIVITTSFTIFSQNIYFQLWLITISYFIILFWPIIY